MQHQSIEAMHAVGSSGSIDDNPRQVASFDFFNQQLPPKKSLDEPIELLEGGHYQFGYSETTLKAWRQVVGTDGKLRRGAIEFSERVRAPEGVGTDDRVVAEFHDGLIWQVPGLSASAFVAQRDRRFCGECVDELAKFAKRIKHCGAGSCLSTQAKKQCRTSCSSEQFRPVEQDGNDSGIATEDDSEIMLLSSVSI